MREIKFRAWNKSVNKMSYFGEPMVSSCETKDGHIWGMFLPSLEGKIYLSKYDDHIMQYTGLEDCSGAEIYDGDIVKVSHGIDKFIMTVIYEELRAGFALWDAKEMVYSDIGEYVEDKMMKLGNIYENPELLEGIGK